MKIDVSMSLNVYCFIVWVCKVRTWADCFTKNHGWRTGVAVDSRAAGPLSGTAPWLKSSAASWHRSIPPIHRAPEDSAWEPGMNHDGQARHGGTPSSLDGEGKSHET